MMLAGRTILNRLGWGFAALVTPTVLLTTGAGFFSLILKPNWWAPVATKIGTTPLMLAVLVGAVQNIMSKSSKYSLFDPCKEMAFIPLGPEEKTKGKVSFVQTPIKFARCEKSLGWF
jgi:AAA family ATP:ADP antiporter